MNAITSGLSSLKIGTFLLALCATVMMHGQAGQNEDVGVRNVVFQQEPLFFPGGATSYAGFEFHADSGATLSAGGYDIGCTICLGALAFDFIDTPNVSGEILGDGAWMWDSWVLNGTCIIGTITQDLPPGSKGMIYFPIFATQANSSSTPYYSANLVNVNLQPHPFDPSADVNDNTFGWTYTSNNSNCVEAMFLALDLPTNQVDVNDNITSNLILDEVDPVQFNAGQSIDLIQGFEVVIGTDFEANIQPCVP